MKVKEAIELLKKQDQEKELMIQQGEEHDYMTAHSIREQIIIDIDEIFDNEDKKKLVERHVVVIQYS